MPGRGSHTALGNERVEGFREQTFLSSLMWGLKEQEAIKRAREGSTNKTAPVGSGVRKNKGRLTAWC